MKGADMHVLQMPSLPYGAPGAAHYQQGMSAARIAHSRWPGATLDEAKSDTANGKWVFNPALPK